LSSNRSNPLARAPVAALWILVVLPLCGGCQQRSDPEATAIFQKAQQTFDRAASPEAFLQAAALDQEILDRGIVSPAVLYHQGNALMRAGQRGRAIAAYRQAQRYRPRDPHLEANLLSATGGEAAPRRPIVEYLLFWQDWLGVGEKFTLAGAAAGLAFALGLAANLLRRRRWAQLALAALAVTLLFSFSAGYDWYRYQYLVHGVSIERQTVARKGYAESYEPALTAPLPEGTEFMVVDRRSGWLLVQLAGGQEGWLPERAAVVY
jgi:tetratricopeptide (TPR) repeat protein